MHNLPGWLLDCVLNKYELNIKCHVGSLNQQALQEPSVRKFIGEKRMKTTACITYLQLLACWLPLNALLAVKNKEAHFLAMWAGRRRSETQNKKIHFAWKSTVPRGITTQGEGASKTGRITAKLQSQCQNTDMIQAGTASTNKQFNAYSVNLARQATSPRCQCCNRVPPPLAKLVLSNF